MTEMLVRAPAFDFAAPERPTGTLLDVARIIEDVGWLEPAGLVDSYNCLRLDASAVWPCPPTTMAAPTQAAASTATTGGTLAAGTYRAVVTAVNARGETIASNEISRVTTGATSTITWTWGAVTGATAYKVYVTALGGAANSETFAATVTAPTTTYTQTAPVVAGGAVPPGSNTAVVSVTKSFNPPGWQDGVRFAVYGGVTCKGPGFDMSAGLGKARAAFEAMESVGVERGLMKQRFVAGATWSAPTDLTPAGGAVTPIVGLALLEGDAACKYAGVPTLHLPRTVTTLVESTSGALVRDGNRLITKQGSKVASGGGYGCPNQGPTGAAPTAGEYWLYGSGEVAVARGEVTAVADIDRTTNDVYALVERPYVAAVDCYAAAVRVKVY